MADPQKILATVRRATELFRQTPGRVGSIIKLIDEQVADVLVVGDLHGHTDVLASVLKVAALDKNPRRHLIVQELVHDTRIDPDDGQIDRSHRAIDLVCALKCQHPDRVHYLLGNHELSELTGRSISKNGHALNRLFQAGVESDYGARSADLVPAYYDLFRALPLLIRLPNRVVVCHTVPDAGWLDSFDVNVLAAEAWPDEAVRRGGTVYALTWGRDTSDETVDRFATLIDADLFVCGHQPCDEGFRQANNRVLIVDGTDPAPAYCLMPAHEPLTIDRLADCARLVPVLG